MNVTGVVGRAYPRRKFVCVMARTGECLVGGMVKKEVLQVNRSEIATESGTHKKYQFMYMEAQSERNLTLRYLDARKRWNG